MTPAETTQGRPDGGRHCGICGTPVRDPGNANAGLCHRHNPDRTVARAAQQRRRRYGTTAPPIALTPPQAHRFYDAMNTVGNAELAVTRGPTTDTLKVLLAALTELHKEVDPALNEISAVLKAHPAAVPHRPK